MFWYSKTNRLPVNFVKWQHLISTKFTALLTVIALGAQYVLLPDILRVICRCQDHVIKKAGKTAGYTLNVVETRFAFYCSPDASPLSMIFHMVDGHTLPIQCKSHMAEQHSWLLTQMKYLHLVTVRNANTIFGRLCWPMIHVTDGRFLAGTIGPSCFGDWHLDLPPPPATCGPGIHLDWWGLPLVVGCRSTAQITRDQNSKK